jgi:hypothetical protein
MDGRVFRVWAWLMQKRSHDFVADAMIAATAVVHGLVVVNRDIHDFAALGVDTFNPFEWREDSQDRPGGRVPGRRV